MKLIKRTLHWTGALALAGVMSASFLAPSTAQAEERIARRLLAHQHPGRARGRLHRSK